MSGPRWTTGIGITLGGVGGAVAALLGAPSRPPAPPVAAAPVAGDPGVVAPARSSPAASPAPPGSAQVPVAAARSAGPAASSAGPAASSAAPASSAGPASSAAPPAPGGVIPAALDLPNTLQALLRAEVLCDRKQQYDECSRAAEALEKGTAGEVDAVQARRFRKIALTYLVKECEGGDPHACFIMAAKYRAGTELKSSPVRAAALETRGLELCRLRSAPECPAR